MTRLPEPARPLVPTPDHARHEAPPAPPLRSPTPPNGRAYRLDDGPALWVVPDASAQIVRVALVSRRGDDGAHPRGLPSLLASLLARQIAERVDRGGRYVVGRGGGDATGLHVVLDAPVDHLDATLVAMHELVVREPVRGGEVELELSRAIDLLEEAGVMRRVALAGLAQLHGEPIRVETAHRTQIARLRRFDGEAAAAARDERFAANESVVVVVGPVDPAAVWARFRDVFGSWRGAPPRRRAPEVVEQARERAVIADHDPGSDLLSVLVLRRAPSLGSPDRAPYEVLMELAGSAMSSRLMTSLREQGHLTYGAHSFVDETSYGAVGTLAARFAPDEAEEGLDRLLTELRIMRSETLSLNEIQAAVGRIWSRLRHSLEGVGVADFLTRAWKAGLSPNALLDTYARLARLTPDALREVARRHFDPTRGLVLVAGDLSDVEGLWVARTPEGFALSDSPD